LFAGDRFADDAAGWFLIPPGQNLAALRPLPVEALRLSEQTTALLDQLGIVTIGQLAALPRASLRSRFGDELLKRWDQAIGTAQEAIVAYRPPPPLEAHWSLEHPTTRRETIECVLTRLLERLVQLLTQRNQGAIQLLCRLDGEAQRTARIEVGLFRASATLGHLRELVQMQLEQLKLPGPVHHVSIRAISTAGLEDQQHQLLEDSARDVPRQLARLVNRLSSRLGRDSVLGARRQSDAQVELAYRYVPLTGQPAQTRRKTTTAKPQNSNAPGTRPLQLYVPPWPVDAIAVVPHGPPVSFLYQGQPHRVAQHWGPERIETGWWRGRSVRRDYYRVEDQQGSRFWLFRRLSDGKWFLQGAFE
jgi:protein ImuB